MNTSHSLTLLALVFAAPVFGASAPAAMLFSVDAEKEQEGKPTLAIDTVFPGTQTVSFVSSTSLWANVGSLAFDLIWPADAPSNAQAMVYVSDWDYLWFQHDIPGRLEPGSTNRIRINLRPESTDWRACGHYSRWNLRAMMKPREFGLRVFADDPFKGAFTLRNGDLSPRREAGPPTIRNVRANTGRLACYDKFEVLFELPERHLNPFDPDEIDVRVKFKTPSGDTATVAAFYKRDFYREGTPSGEHFVPQGGPLWCARFTPTVPGKHVYTIMADDGWGDADWGPGVLTATPPRLPGFVKVSARDPRFLEFSNGEAYNPVGHNVRSPFDVRMDAAFPWRQRWVRSSSVYEHYLARMAEAGENWTEVWSAAWSLGLEWADTYPWHHGIGQYNMRNAWEMDRVLELAEHHGIYVNFVVHNHGKFSNYWDPEWHENPFNVKMGGYLTKPEEYFTDPRAVRSFRNLMRYIIARWGYSTHIFAWQLWSELDLVGLQKGWTDLENTFLARQETVDWHRQMGRAIQRMDPYDHMISTHVALTYARQNPKVTALPELSLSCVDAYYYTSDPTDIIALLRKTADNGNSYGKPILATEFGGSPHAAPVGQLHDCLHAGLWSSVALTLAGSPMFWWWQIVEEEDLYGEFAALSRYMKGEDRRDPTLKTAPLQVRLKTAATSRFAALSLKNDTRGYGWLYDVQGFSGIRSRRGASGKNLSIVVPDVAPDATFAVEFWDTSIGAAVRHARLKAVDGILKIPFPPFRRDIAFKFRAVD